MHVVPFQAEHVGAAAELLARTHGANSPAPLAVVSDHEVGAKAVAGQLGSAPAFAAIEGGELVGFLAAPWQVRPGQPAVRIVDVLHAADGQCARAAYRAMWEAMSGALTAVGCFEHRILVLAEPRSVLQAHFELGFGVDQIKGIRQVPPGGHSGTAEEATPADTEALLRLVVELSKYHSRPPMLAPALMDVAASRTDLLQSIGNEDHLVLALRRDGTPIAMMQAQPDRRYPRTLTIYINVVTEPLRASGVGTTMLNDLLAWAAARSYRHCAVGWTSANLVSDSFYRAREFRPIRYELVRRIDPRVSWANDALDLPLFAQQDG